MSTTTTTTTTIEPPTDPPPRPLSSSPVPTPTPTPTPPPPPPSAVKLEPTDAKDAPPPPPSPPPHPSALTIPAHSRWFSWHSVHDTERRALPEFFDGRSPARTLETYRYLRDSIIRQYWESPGRRITFTDARRRLVADAGSVRRVFDFLEQWGLVNYVSVVKRAASPPQKMAEEERKEATETEKVVVEVRKVCTSCGMGCSQACFASDKQADVILCAKCFVRGNYRGGLTSGDFKRVDMTEEEGRTSRVDWSEKETLHLLEAVLHHGDDWKRVADHVGNGRSQKDCVARFVKLPFGEQFMGSLGGGQLGGDNCGENMGRAKNDSESVDELPPAKRIHLTPLADASNPIMAQVAFLSAMVGSEVAEAAAGAAVEALNRVENASLHYRNDAKNGYIVAEEENTDTASSQKAFDDAVADARLLLEQEQRDVEQSISDTMEIQMKEMQEKILRFEEMELLMEKERLQVQHLKNILFSDQLSLIQLKARYGPIENSTPTTSR